MSAVEIAFSSRGDRRAPRLGQQRERRAVDHLVRIRAHRGPPPSSARAPRANAAAARAAPIRSFAGAASHASSDDAGARLQREAQRLDRRDAQVREIGQRRGAGPRADPHAACPSTRGQHRLDDVRPEVVVGGNPVHARGDLLPDFGGGRLRVGRVEQPAPGRRALLDAAAAGDQARRENRRPTAPARAAPTAQLVRAFSTRYVVTPCARPIR